MKPEEFKNYSESIKNIVLVLSVAIGGAWAWYVFDAKLEVQNSKAKLEILNRSLINRPVIIPSINVSLLSSELQNIWYLKTTVALENKGNFEGTIFMDDDPLIVAKGEFNNGSIVDYKEYVRTSYHILRPKKFWVPHFKHDTEKLWVSKQITISPNQNKTMQFVTKISSPGLYRVQYLGYPDKNIIKIKSTFEKDSKSVHILNVDEYVVVPPTSNVQMQPTSKLRR